MANAAMTQGRAKAIGERMEYRFYFFLLYPIFFLAALIGVAAPRADGRGARRDVFRRASDMARSVIPWVFSGR